MWLIIFLLPNLCVCDQKVDWKSIKSSSADWMDPIFGAGFPKVDTKILKTNESEDKVYLQVDKDSGKTEYAIVDLQNSGSLTRAYVTQEDIFRSAAERQCEHLINVNSKWYKKLPMTHIYFTKIEKTLKRLASKMENITNVPEQVKKFRSIQKAMERITRIGDMNPLYCFQSEIEQDKRNEKLDKKIEKSKTKKKGNNTKEKPQEKKENLLLCALLFDASKIKTWEYTYRIYFTGNEVEGSSQDLPEEEICVPEMNDEEDADAYEPCSSEQSANRIPDEEFNVTNELVSAASDFFLPFQDECSSSQSEVHNTNKHSDQKVNKGKLSRGYFRENGFGIAVVIVKVIEDKLSLFGSNILVAKCKNSSYVQNLIENDAKQRAGGAKSLASVIKDAVHWYRFKLWKSGYSYKWKEVGEKLKETSLFQGNINCTQYGTTSEVHFYLIHNDHTTTLAVVWIDDDFPDQFIIIKKANIAEITRKIGSTFGKLKNKAKHFFGLEKSYEEIPTEVKVDQHSLNHECFGYKGWKAVHDSSRMLFTHLDLYLQDFANLFYNLKRNWRILLIKEPGSGLSKPKNNYLMIFGVYYVYTEEHINDPWFGQENIQYFCALVANDHKTKLEASRTMGSDLEHNIIYAITYAHKSWEAVPTCYDLQDVYNKLVKDYPQMHHLVQVGQDFRAFYFKNLTKNTTTGYNVKTYFWKSNVWNLSNEVSLEPNKVHPGQKFSINGESAPISHIGKQDINWSKDSSGKWIEICSSVGYNYTELNLIEYDASYKIHFYLLQAKTPVHFLYLFLIAYLNGNQMICLDKSELTEAHFIEYSARRNFVKFLDNKYHDNTILHHKVGEKILDGGIVSNKPELKSANQQSENINPHIKEESKTFSFSRQFKENIAFKKIKTADWNDVYHYKSDLYFDPEYNLHHLQAFIFRPKNFPAKYKGTSTGNIVKAIGNWHLPSLSSSTSRKWKTVVMITKAKEMLSFGITYDNDKYQNAHRYEKYDEQKCINKWAFEKAPEYTGWTPLKNKEDSNNLDNYIQQYVMSEYEIVAAWTVLLVKEMSRLKFFTQYYFAFGYHSMETHRKYFCVLLHKDFQNRLRKTNNAEKQGVLMALAFDLDALEIISTATELEEEYFAQQTDLTGVAHLASLKHDEVDTLFPQLQFFVQRGMHYRGFLFKINTNIDTIGYALVTYTYDKDRKAWIGYDTDIFGNGYHRSEKLNALSGQGFRNDKKETSINMPTWKSNEEPDLKTTYTKLEKQFLPKWSDITTIDDRILKLDAQSQKFQRDINGELRDCACTIINKDTQNEIVKYLEIRALKKNSPHRIVTGISEDSYFFVHKFEERILFYRSDLSSYTSTLSAVECYMSDIIEWKKFGEESEPELNNIGYKIMYQTKISKGVLAICQIQTNYQILLVTNAKKKRWGFTCRCVETLLRMRKSYVLSTLGWNSYNNRAKLIWQRKPYEVTKQEAEKHTPPFWNIFAQLGRLRELILQKIYHAIESPMQFKERKNHIEALLTEALQKHVEIINHGFYKKDENNPSKVVKVVDVDGAGVDLSSNAKQMFALIFVKPFPEEPGNPTSASGRTCYQCVSLNNFIDLDFNPEVGGYSSPFFAAEKFAQDAVEFEHMLNGS